MSKKLKVNSACRICKSGSLTKFLDLGKTPLANAFLSENETHHPEEVYPLEVYFCHNCNLVQLIHVVSKEKLFRDYIYFPSHISGTSGHFREYAEDVRARFLGNKKGFVVEIGSNDGLLLEEFKDSGFRVLGIDPASNIAAVVKKRGTETIAEFFSEDLAAGIAARLGQADVILANNVVAHIDDHIDLAKGIDALLDANGVFIFEAPYLVDMFKNLTYDTIYHEHLSYLAVSPLLRLFKNFDLEIFDVKLYDVQGQSIRVFVGRRGCHPKSTSVGTFIRNEKYRGLDKLETYTNLARRIEESRDKLNEVVGDISKGGKKIAAYGASAKGNTLLNYCKLGTDSIEYAADDMPSKHGLYTPGMHIPVYDMSWARQHPPDYFLLLSWNYKVDILEKEKEYRANGGKFIIPVGDINIM